MRSANKLGARWVVLLGEAEAQRHVAQLKDMASGEQVEIPWKELAESLA
jgi:histidyl-tRNA synthetase